MGRVNPVVFKGKDCKQLLPNLDQINEFLSCLNLQKLIICLEDEGMLQQECKIPGEKTSKSNRRRGMSLNIFEIVE